MRIYSAEFVLGLVPMLVGVCWVLARVWGTRGAVWGMVVGSAGFYAWAVSAAGWWQAAGAVWLLAGSVGVNYWLGRMLVNGEAGRAALAGGVVGNVLLLAAMKYGGGLGGHWVLPVGMSFYTFTQIGFLVDMYREGRRGGGERLTLGRYCWFVVFFPKLLSGPIVRYREMVVGGVGVLRGGLVAGGLVLVTVGLFKKLVVADGLAPWVDEAFGGVDGLTSLAAWAAAVGYSMQLYFDFSGYSDMAVGVGMLFGVRLPQNFNAPYKARSLMEFWGRWHMTLSRFLRDYVYIPLGGNRVGVWRGYLNVMIVMVVAGVWHGGGAGGGVGSSATFVVWGVYQGVMLCVAQGWREVAGRIGGRLGRGVRLWWPVAWGLTFVTVVVGRVFFRAEDLEMAWGMLGRMADVGGVWRDGLTDGLTGGLAGGWWQAAVLAGLVVFVTVMPTIQEWMGGKDGHGRRLTRRHAVLFGVMFFVCILMMVQRAGAEQMFIYFRF